MQLGPHGQLPAAVVWATNVARAVDTLERNIGTLQRQVDALAKTNTAQLAEINELRRRINLENKTNATDTEL